VNNFAHIKPLFKYKKVAYYSVVLNNGKKTLYEEFVEKHDAANKNKLYHILKWLKAIGNIYGAQSRFFRNEAFTSDTSALPPVGKDKKPFFIEKGIKKNNTLRLYCLRANENVVFLYSGDVKTANKAQECPNVKPHFLLANQLTKAIDKAFKNNEIIWNEDATLIDCDNNLKLYYE
jgi:hypothetical protein